MGTNYYVDEERDCPTCHRRHMCLIHIGKSSAGWKFTFAWNSGDYYKSLQEMKDWLKGRKITDEYGRKITRAKFWAMVRAKENEGHDHIQLDRGAKHGVIVDGIYFMEGEFS
jgi:hypothetical protein